MLSQSTKLLKIRQIDIDKDMEMVIDLLRECFPDTDAQLCLKTFMDVPSFHPEYMRLGEINDEIVSFVMFAPQKIKIGSAILSGGWIYFGCTKPEYRRRGFYTTLHKNMLQFLQQKGYHLVMLYGSVKPYLYLGYIPSFYRSLISIPLKKIKPIKGPYQIRRCQEKDIDALKELYDFYVQERTSVNLLRPNQFWKTALKCYPHRQGLLIVEDHQTHEIKGYLWIKPPSHGMFWLGEAEVRNHAACQTILAYCVQEGKQLNLSKIYFLIPLNHPLGKFCLSQGASESSKPACLKGNKHGAADMLNLLNPIPTLKTMEQEFERLILDSNYRDWTGKIPFEIDNEKCALCIESGKVRFSPVNQHQNNLVKIPKTILSQLVVGFKAVGEIKDYPGVSIAPQFLELLPILFPKRYPQAPTWEWEFPGD